MFCFILLFSVALIGCSSGEELPVGLILDGCPAVIESPIADNFDISKVFGKWYVTSVGSLSFLKLLHGECFSLIFEDQDDDVYDMHATYVHEGSLIQMEGTFTEGDPGYFIFDMPDNSNPTVILAATNDYLLWYSCEEDLLEDGRGFGQVWAFTRTPDDSIENYPEIWETEMNGATLPSLQAVRQGGDCPYIF